MIESLRNFFKDEDFQLILYSSGVYLKNYQRLISLDDDYVSFYVNHKKIIIKGSHLILKRVLDYEVFIQGIIHHIEVSYEE